MYKITLDDYHNDEVLREWSFETKKEARRGLKEIIKEYDLVKKYDLYINYRRMIELHTNY